MSMTHEPTIRHPGEGRTIGVVGDVYRFLATGEEGRQLSLSQPRSRMIDEVVH